MFEFLKKENKITKVDLGLLWEYLVQNVTLDIKDLELYFSANSEDRVQEAIIAPELKRELISLLIEIDEKINWVDRPGNFDGIGMSNRDLSSMLTKINNNYMKLARKSTKENHYGWKVL